MELMYRNERAKGLSICPCSRASADLAGCLYIYKGLKNPSFRSMRDENEGNKNRGGKKFESNDCHQNRNIRLQNSVTSTTITRVQQPINRLVDKI